MAARATGRYHHVGDDSAQICADLKKVALTFIKGTLSRYRMRDYTKMTTYHHYNGQLRRSDIQIVYHDMRNDRVKSLSFGLNGGPHHSLEVFIMSDNEIIRFEIDHSSFGGDREQLHRYFRFFIAQAAAEQGATQDHWDHFLNWKIRQDRLPEMLANFHLAANDRNSHIASGLRDVLRTGVLRDLPAFRDALGLHGVPGPEAGPYRNIGHHTI